MKKLLILVSVVFLAALVVLIVFAPEGGDVSPSGGAVVSDLGQIEMLESDQQMLERMRVSMSPDMATMTDQNPMWVDPDMIRLQEEYQAQLDRMLGRRPNQP